MELVESSLPEEAEALVLVGGPESEYTLDSVVRSFYATARLRRNTSLNYSERDGVGCAEFTDNHCRYELCVGGGKATLTITRIDGGPLQVPEFPPTELVPEK